MGRSGSPHPHCSDQAFHAEKGLARDAWRSGRPMSTRKFSKTSIEARFVSFSGAL
jgi:hypothetical protein